MSEAAPSCLIIVDGDRRQFTVEGPLRDDSVWRAQSIRPETTVAILKAVTSVHLTFRLCRLNTGAQYEISIDGVPRSYRDRKVWGSAPAPLRACARHHSSCLTLRLRFNLPQSGVSIIRAAPQGPEGASVAGRAVSEVAKSEQRRQTEGLADRRRDRRGVQGRKRMTAHVPHDAYHGFYKDAGRGRRKRRDGDHR
jgi:hypothetical protein